MRRPVAHRGPVAGCALPALPALRTLGVRRRSMCDAPASSAPARTSLKLLDAREAGEAFAALLDSDLATAGVDFALARINAARGDEVLHIELPDDAPPRNVELIFLASAAAASGTSYPRVQLHRGPQCASAARRATPVGRADADVGGQCRSRSSRCGPARSSIMYGCRTAPTTASVFDTLVAQVGDSADYRLRTRDTRRQRLALHAVHQARRPRRRAASSAPPASPMASRPTTCSPRSNTRRPTP